MREAFVPKDIEFKRITEENLENAENMVISDPLYGTEGKAIEKIFKDYKENNDIQVVMMKICLLDFTNGTNINKHRSKISLYEIARKITLIDNVDKRIEDGDPTVVNEIARCVDATDEELVNLFSFASKYCHYHNKYSYEKDDYSIFDSVVQTVLPIYFKGKITRAKIESWRKNYKYENFNKFIGDRLDELNISVTGRRRKFDHFLWYLNKDKMPIRQKDNVIWVS